jgi:hypothetical protein
MFELVELVKANDKKHKWEVKLYNTETKKMNTVKFGAYGMKDYTIYNKEEGKKIADTKKKAYIARHSGMGEDWTKEGINTAGFWSRWLLWEKPTIEESLKALIKKFNIKIHNPSTV